MSRDISIYIYINIYKKREITEILTFRARGERKIFNQMRALAQYRKQQARGQLIN